MDHFVEALKSKSVLESSEECMSQLSDIDTESERESDTESNVDDGIEYLGNDFGEENFDWGDFPTPTLTVKTILDLIEDGETEERKEEKDEESDKDVGDELPKEHKEEICVAVVKDGQDFSAVKFYRNYNRQMEIGANNSDVVSDTETENENIAETEDTKDEGIEIVPETQLVNKTDDEDEVQILVVKVPGEAQDAPDIAQDELNVVVPDSENVVSDEQDIPITLHEEVIDSSAASDDGKPIADGTYSIGDFLAVDFGSLLLPPEVCYFSLFHHFLSLFCHFFM